MAELPNGMVTFLFTDIEGSTKRWEQYPRAMRVALARHDEILRGAIEEHGGYVFQTIGDAFCAAFANAGNAVAAALQAQHALHTEQWGEEIGNLRVRIVIHTGEAELRGGDYFGPPTLNRIGAILSVTHGGQTLLSSASADLVRDHLSPATELADLGERRLRDLARPEHLYQLNSIGLPTGFPPLKTLDTRPNNLPAQTNPLFGREQEVAAALTLMRRPDVRLLTITGPNGSGKTRLGLQIAAALLDDFEHGVFFVPLTAVNDHELVTTAIANTLDVDPPLIEGRGTAPLSQIERRQQRGTNLLFLAQGSSSDEMLDSLKRYLRDRQMLLVLDQFEPVIDAAPLITQLLAAAPGLKALVTSAEELRLYGEYEFPLAPPSDEV